MKTIGIITIVSQNYGNRLQNYALQTVLQELGYYVETIRRTNNSVLLSIKNYIHYVWKTNNTTQFFRFNKRIVWSRKAWKNESQLDELNKKYNFFIAGSDQIWNPYYSFAGTDIDFLTFVEDTRKIAYAASFGVDSIPDEKIGQYKKYMEGFSKISTREHAGADIVFELTGRRVPVFIDPVFLLDAECWRKIEKRPHKMPKGNYSLVYAVETMSDELKFAVEKEKENNQVLEVRKLNGKEWSVGPAEFLYLIDHADKILTDSFHGTAFSIIFHIPFYIYQRDGRNMNSRMDTLLDDLKLKGVSVYSEELFEKCDELLLRKKKEAIFFLKDALGE